MRIIMLGGPGAGKGTQAKRIAKQYDLPHISTGDIFRIEMEAGTEIGKMVKVSIDKGQLVQDDIVIELVEERISREDCKNGYVLDGFPRTIPQAVALEKFLESKNEKIDHVVNFLVPDENIVNRMAGRRVCLNCGATYHTEHNPTKVAGICDVCGNNIILREDDKPETVLRRLHVYHEVTKPLIDYYTKKGVIDDVDGTQGLEEVFEAIVAIVER